MKKEFLIMSAELSRKYPEDEMNISLNEDWEIYHWTQTLVVQEEKLRQAINAVGVVVPDVKYWLQTH
ncbi:MAG: hypothetical protein ACI86X_001144 [Moritella sp.]